MSHSDAFAVRDLLGPRAAVARRAITGEHGISLPPFIDHHVHLHLVDGESLASGGITGVVDLGGDPVSLARRRRAGIPHVAYAGAFLTAPGGYPSSRAWAPDEIVREVSDPSTSPGVHGGAATAVDEQATFGASVIKVALNADAGPTFNTVTLAAVVASARERGLPVVAHVEGTGMTRAAIDAGIDVLAHTPFTETLDHELVGRAVLAGQRWISTLDIHRDDPSAREATRLNLAAFVAAGGRVLYGTDLGNGDQPRGVNVRELEAMDAVGIRGPALIGALSDPWPRSIDGAGVATFVPGAAPESLDDVARWLGGATVVPTEELIHDDH